VLFLNFLNLLNPFKLLSTKIAMNRKNSMKILYRMRYGLLLAALLSAANNVFGQIQLSFSFTPPSCYGYTDGTATVTPSGGAEPYAYLWNNGQSGQTNYGLGAGTVFVTVTDQNGLTATGSVVVTQPEPLEVIITAAGFSCSSNNGTLTANHALCLRLEQRPNHANDFGFDAGNLLRNGDGCQQLFESCRVQRANCC
jgi:hypothetical protein